MAKPKSEKIDELLDEVLDAPMGGSDEELLELESMVVKDEALRRHLVRRLFDESLIFSEASRSHSEDLFQYIGPAKRRSREFSQWLKFASLAAAIMLACIWGWRQSQSGLETARGNAMGEMDIMDMEHPEGSVVDLHPRDECAILTKTVNTTWNANCLSPKLGSTLSAGRLAFDSGLIQLEFCSGARVVVEGPADFDIVSPNKMVCNLGKLRAFAPPQASGFVVTVPGMDVVDLGTEFALGVSEDGESEVHVLTGEVRLEPEEDSRQRLLREGESAAFDPQGGIGDVAEQLADVAKVYLGGAELAALHEQMRQVRLREHANRKSKLRDDPSTLVYFDFSQSSLWSSIVENRSPRFGSELNGAAIGCEWRDGRWDGDSSIEMKGVSDRIRLDIPGEYEAVTFMAWVNMDGFNRQRNALVLSDGWEIGAAHWQLAEGGRLVLGISEKFNESRGVFEGMDYKSPPVIDRSDLGRWVLFVTTYDVARKEINHFCNGKKVSTHAVRQNAPLRFGPTEIGNWRPEAQQTFLTRAFNGRFAEFALISRVLSEDEVAATFEVGRP